MHIKLFHIPLIQGSKQMIQLGTTYLEQYTYTVKTSIEPTLCQFDPT